MGAQQLHAAWIAVTIAGLAKPTTQPQSRSQTASVALARFNV